MSQRKIQQRGLWRAPGARSQTLWPLAKAGGSPTSHLSSVALWILSGNARSLARPSHPQKAHPGECCPRTAPPVTHHPLHLLRHLVATQVVVEGALSPPVRRVVPDGVGSLAIHLGDHGLLFFLGEQHRGISLWAGLGRRASVWFLIPPECLARSAAAKAAALFSARPGAQRSAGILELTRESILIPPHPNASPGGPGGGSRTRQ